MAKKSKIMIMLLSFLFAAVCASACGQEETGPEDVEPAGGRKLYDLSAEKWKGYEEVSEDSDLWTAAGYWEYLEPEMTDGTIYSREYSATDGSDYYVLYSHATYEENFVIEETIYLTHLDLLTMEVTTTELAPFEGQTVSEEVPGLAELAAAMNDCRAFIEGMDVLDGKMCLFIVQRDQESKVASQAYAVYLDAALKAERIMDITSGLQRAGVLGDVAAPDGIRCDKEGRIYIGTFQVAVIDADGKFLRTLECPGSPDSAVLCTGRLPDGALLFEAMDPESGDAVIFCLDGRKERVLYRARNAGAQIRYINSYGQILSLQAGQLLLWDAAEGSCRQLYRDTDLMGFNYDTVTQTPDGAVIVIYYDVEGFYWVRLQPTADVEETVISVQAIWGIDQKLERTAAEYSRKHPGVRIELIRPEQGAKGEITMNKLMAQLSVGQGPDILILHRDEMLLLQDKGALADLSELLPQELLDQIFPAVLGYGMADGRLWGIAYSARINTLAVSEELWQEETWTFRDVMRLVEEREAAGEPAAWLSGQDVSPDNLLYYLAIKDVAAGGSSLVDMEQKQCYFDTKEFVRLLEFCRKQGKISDSYEHIPPEEHAAQIHAGDALAYPIYGSLAEFSYAMAALGDGYKCVGYPTDSGSGSYISCPECLAVTAVTEKYEVVCDFLQYLMSERAQRSVASVRRDILSTYVVEDPGSSEGPYFLVKKRTINPLGGKPDGSSFLPEYMEIMENGISDEGASSQIRSIVSEEAGAYFAGDKSAEEAAEIIQRRVWLYLNE